MDEFVRAYEQMAAEVERVVAQYPEEMRDDLRDHAQAVLDARLRAMWRRHYDGRPPGAPGWPGPN